jgi:hypothetical protein
LEAGWIVAHTTIVGRDHWPPPISKKITQGVHGMEARR